MILSIPRATRPAGGRSPAGLSGESGLAAVEFALVAPVFLTLLFGVIIYGLQFGAWLAVNHAAAEGARASVAGMDDIEREGLAVATADAVLEAYGPILGDSGWTVEAGPSAEAHLYEVTVRYERPDQEVDGGWGDGSLDELLPLPTDAPEATVTVAKGGY